MNTYKLRHKQTKQHDYNFDDLYEEISYHWQHKAQALQARRWRALRQEVRPNVTIA